MGLGEGGLREVGTEGNGDSMQDSTWIYIEVIGQTSGGRFSEKKGEVCVELGNEVLLSDQWIRKKISLWEQGGEEVMKSVGQGVCS